MRFKRLALSRSLDSTVDTFARKEVSSSNLIFNMRIACAAYVRPSL